jgi:3-phenylpropionate/trans-cinnamate dioxygenase ferredoxin component
MMYNESISCAQIEYERKANMKYTLIAHTTELPAGQKKKVILENREILLVNIEDSFYAIDNRCSHMGGSLFEGNMDGYSVICPRHGSRFDVRTGKLIETGKILYIKVKAADLHSYPLKVEGTDILIGNEYVHGKQ